MKGFFGDLAKEVIGLHNGVTRRKYTLHSVTIDKMTIGDSKKNLTNYRQSGDYYNIDIGDDIGAISSAIADILHYYIHDKKNILIVGFGNSNYTSDRLGEECIAKVDLPFDSNVYKLSPSVKGLTGISSIDIVKVISRLVHADIIIAIDTLATYDISHLGGSVQITDAGISPGSGVGADKAIASMKTLGVKVVGIGVPLVYKDRKSGIYLTLANVDSYILRLSKMISKGITTAISHI